MGWALGAFEAGLVLSSLAHFATGLWFLTMAVVTPMMLYGWGGWVLGKLPLGRRMPWDALYFLGLLVMVHMRRQLYLGTDGWGWVVGGALASFAIWWLSRDRDEAPALRWLGRLSGVFGVYAVVRLRSFAETRPSDRPGWGELGSGFELGADWPWLLAAAAVLLLPLLTARRWGVSAPVWVPRISAAAIAIPFLALGSELVTKPQPIEGYALTGSAADAAQRPNVVLVTWDTVRRDTLPLYGGGGLDTPHCMRLAEEGVTFDEYRAVAPITAPSHNSMLTGLYPRSHGLRKNGELVQLLQASSDELLPRLPEVFGLAGYATAGFVSAMVVRRDFAFETGFQYFDDRPKLDALSPFIAILGFVQRVTVLGDRLLPGGLDFMTYTTPGDVTTDRALEWYAAQDRPAFLWVHLFDAHDPRELREPYWERVQARREEGPHAVNPECQESLVQQRAEIEFLDAQLGRLLEGLEAKDPGLANTWIMLTADHGECFGEGGDVPELFGEGGIKVLHVPSLYEATQRVALVVRPPGGSDAAEWPRGVRRDGYASHVDLYPTLCEAAGLGYPASELQGMSLLPAMRGETLPDRGVYMEAYGATNGDNRLEGWLEGDWKYVRTVDGRLEFLYRRDTGDAVDYAATEPATLDRMRDAFDRSRAALQEVESIDAGTGADALEALGYAGGDEDETQ